MTTTGAPATFLELTTDLLNRMRADSTTTTQITMAKRYLNVASQDVHVQQNWPWAERPALLQTHAPYRDGSVSIATTARTAVTGASTLWATDSDSLGMANARAGGRITFSGTLDPYSVASVTSDTALILADRWIGDTLTASAYTYYEDEYDLASDFFRMIDARQFTDVLNIPILGRQEFYRRFPRNATGGTPTVCTLIDLGPGTSASSRPRVVFHPYPDSTMNIPYRYMTKYLAVSATGVTAEDMVADTDQPIIPLRYRHVLILYAALQWYRDRKDDARSQEVGQEYVDLVKRMSGDSEPSRDRPRFVPKRPRYPVFLGRRGQARFTTGDAFDTMRE